MADFWRDQERWLNPYAHLGRPARRNGRHGRFHLGMDALPRPDFETAPRHVLQVFAMRLIPAVEVDGWKGIALGLVKQPQWWYTALCLQLAQVAAEQHAASCGLCDERDWAFLLGRQVRLPRNTTFDIEGNTKPEEEKP